MDSGKSQHNRRSGARRATTSHPGRSGARNERPTARSSYRSARRVKPSRIGQIDNVGPAVRSTSFAPAKSAQAPQTPRPTQGASQSQQGPPRPTASDGTLLSRRRFLYGALGVGALAAAAIGAGAVIASRNGEDDGAVFALSVPTGSVTTLDALTLVEDATTLMRETANVELPFGSLVWAANDTVAACLMPTETGSPLTRAALISLESAAVTTVLEQAEGRAEGFEIYDVRANEQGIVWTEANILDGVWRIYTATLTGGFGRGIGSPVLADSGGPETQTPSIAAVGPFAFWQVNPQAADKSNTIASTVRRAQLGTADAETVVTSPRRLAAPLYALADAVVFAQRVVGTTSHQLTKMNAESGEVEDTLVLPRGMAPLHAAYGKSGFMFSFESIYNYGEGISNLGTYAPRTAVVPDDYSAAPWFCFGRTPTAAPAWCGKYLIVKSSYSVCGVDLDAGTYFALDVDDGADDYGEYLASTGQGNAIVTFTNIDYQPVGSDAVKTCRVKIRRPVA